MQNVVGLRHRAAMWLSHHVLHRQDRDLSGDATQREAKALVEKPMVRTVRGQVLLPGPTTMRRVGHDVNDVTPQRRVVPTERRSLARRSVAAIKLVRPNLPSRRESEELISRTVVKSK